MKNFFFPIFLTFLGLVGGVRSEAFFQGSELSKAERAYVEDVVDRFEEIDSVALVGMGCGGVASALLELSYEALVVSFSQRGIDGEDPRHEVFLGDPLLSVLAFKNELLLERFDVIFVSFPGEFREVLRLLYALKGVAHDETLLIFTGVEIAESHLAAWRRCIQWGMIEETNSLSDGCGHFWKEGRFLFSKIFSDE